MMRDMLRGQPAESDGCHKIFQGIEMVLLDHAFHFIGLRNLPELQMVPFELLFQQIFPQGYALFSFLGFDPVANLRDGAGGHHIF